MPVTKSGSGSRSRVLLLRRRAGGLGLGRPARRKVGHVRDLDDLREGWQLSRPISLLRVSLLRFVGSNFPGKSIYAHDNSTPEN